MSKKAPKTTPVDKAFTGSDKHTLDDLKLQPWTPDRIIKAQEIGLIFPNIGKQDWQLFRKTGVYPGAVRDVMIFVFLSTLEPEEVEEATYREAKAFGVKRGLHIADGKAFWEAYAKFMQVQNEIDASVALPKANGSEPPDDDDDDPKD